MIDVANRQRLTSARGFFVSGSRGFMIRGVWYNKGGRSIKGVGLPEMAPPLAPGALWARRSEIGIIDGKQGENYREDTCGGGFDEIPGDLRAGGAKGDCGRPQGRGRDRQDAGEAAQGIRGDEGEREGGVRSGEAAQPLQRHPHALRGREPGDQERAVRDRHGVRGGAAGRPPAGEGAARST